MFGRDTKSGREIRGRFFFECEKEMHRTALRLKKTDFGRIVSSSGPEKGKKKIVIIIIKQSLTREGKNSFPYCVQQFKWSLPPRHRAFFQMYSFYY